MLFVVLLNPNTTYNITWYLIYMFVMYLLVGGLVLMFMYYHQFIYT